MDRSWILVGMMGAGKTSVGRELSRITGREHVDTDHLLQRKLGRPIPQLFSIYGEEAFRQHETAVLKDLEPGLFVVSTGGGIVMREPNWVEMRRLGTVIYLAMDFEALTERLSTSKKVRPLLLTENWEERVQTLLEARKPLYEQADMRIEASGLQVAEVALKVLLALEAHAAD